MVKTRKQTKAQDKSKVKRVCNPNPLQSRKEQVCDVSLDESQKSSYHLSLRSSPGPFHYLLDEWLSGEQADDDVDALNSSYPSYEITSSPATPISSTKLGEKHCVSNCKHGRKYERGMTRCCLCMNLFHTECLADSNTASQSIIWNCNKCRQLPQLVLDLSTQLTAIQLTIANMGQVTAGLEEQFAAKSEECLRLSEENVTLKALITEKSSKPIQAEQPECIDECPLLVELKRPEKQKPKNHRYKQAILSEQSTQTDTIQAEYRKVHVEVMSSSPKHEMSNRRFSRPTYSQAVRNERINLQSNAKGKSGKISKSSYSNHLNNRYNHIHKQTAHNVQPQHHGHRRQTDYDYHARHAHSARDFIKSDIRQYGYDDNDSGSRHEYMPSQDRLRVCCFCGEENHKADRCRYGQQVRCFGCDRLGHKKHRCPWI